MIYNRTHKVKRYWGFLPLLIFLLSASSVSAATLQKPPNNLGLVGYWPMNEGTSTQAGDFSGRGNTGTLTNMANPATGTSGWGNGKLAGGLNFDGVDDSVDIGTGSSLNVSGAGAVSLWFKQNGAPVGYHALVNKFNTNGYQLYITYNSLFSFWSGSTINSTYTLSSSDLSWHHYVVTTNGTTLTFYVDGIQKGTGNMGFGSSVPTVHALGVFGSNKTNGVMDDVRIYNRALSVAEIANLYQSGSAKLNTSQNNKVTNGLVGLWYFDGADMSGTTAYDRSGSGNNGTLTNGPLRAIGKVGQGLSFDGSNDYVNSANNFDSSVFSVCAWIYPTASNTLARVITTPSGNTTKWSIIFNTSKVSFDVNSGTAPGTSALALNNWYHVCGTYDGANKLLYLNSINQIASGAGSIAYDAGTGIRIGARHNTSRFFAGGIDDVRIYNRALTQAEITQLYNMGGSKINAPQNNIPGSTLQSGLVGLWSFNGPDMSGTTAYDRSTSGNNGTLTNGPLRAIGKVGQGLYFDGTDDYVAVPHSATLNSYPLTVSAWFKTSMTGNAGIVNKYVSSSANGYQLYFNNGTLCAWYIRDGGNHVWNGGNCSLGAGGLNNNTWHNAVFVVDSSGGAMYVDGTLRATQVWSGSPGVITTTQGISIGYYPNSAGNFRGFIDDVRIYNRALTQVEVTQLYNIGR
ncbi:MAG: hypothetical protein A2747_02435 [Candidatus Yonathbacteria bacterium RIFCSPHIGHO2_01_FULL_44_41]|uniref:LamG-like jellyroll fold domain-containing protein n=1 Tax=Candidatus Yonathbacteria bacterium RIFCSPHIGHO2_02_FULL_44_14 TaxID=1802724 RepID=A0A1G2S7S6_9BACT|nr:MAG: hypothetical protein A2747_02435 [Candidatus Yonathbacteria bacterium RIFCSPHIGHO2_01_FULL_44_41]OHA80749.1 MAG: hypothetical protein A3D51_03870 [Candidatus Yonathbacteria bacterium RIFCSPHIGHO2_02_FULL_44_14]OHA82079.1 MAG: hypothetical protein A3B06_01040 [Candidatus Yonathbacteria bacterium RIFCSPLOWO2_01_FULL_43_20]